MVDLTDLAARLDADEKLRVTYRFPARSADGQVECETRDGKLLDVAEEAGVLYVEHKGQVVWVKLEEVDQVAPDCHA